jgi:YggT family protein
MTSHEIKTQSTDRVESVSIEQSQGYEHQERIVEDLGAERRLLTFRITRVIYLLTGVLEGLLGLRFIFKLIDANPNNLFAHGIYRFSDLFVAPFSTLLVNPSVNGIVLEITTLIAMLIYLLLSWLVVQLVWLFFYRMRTRTVTTVDRDSRNHPIQ